MAPEIIIGEKYSKSVDTYAFSLIAYQLLTNKMPFSIASSFKLQEYVTDGNRPDIRIINNEQINNFLVKCWSHNPKERLTFKLIIEEITNDNFLSYFNVQREKVVNFLKKNSNNCDVEPNHDIFYENSNDTIDYAHKLMIGDGIPANKIAASKIYKNLADQGNERAIFNYGIMNLYGDGIPKNNNIAYQYLKISADKGNPKAMLIYANELSKNEDSLKREQAKNYYKRAADLGNVEAMLRYTSICMKDKGNEEDVKDAARYCQKYAEDGNIDAQLFYACMLKNGVGVAKNVHESAIFMEKAANGNNIYAMHNYGVMLYYGDGININQKEGIKYLKKSADLGYQKSKDLYDVISNESFEIKSQTGLIIADLPKLSITFMKECNQKIKKRPKKKYSKFYPKVSKC